MNVVSPLVELLWITQDPEQQIEAAGRTCYKSEDKITPKSAGKFVDVLRKSGHHAMLEHAAASFRIITDRGITHEIVRHRLASYAQESTRYCNYSKDKFDNECSFIQPPGLTYTQTSNWRLCCELAERGYFQMLEDGCTPQIARSVLPNCLKTEIVMMANLREWRHFIKLRGSAAAHPQIRPIAYGIWDILKDHAPNIFSDLSPLSVLASSVVD
jgi:thymidylate synthase (FAD)